MEYHSAFKREGNSVTCYSLDEPEDMMLNGISQSQQDKCCMIPLIRGAESSPIHRVRK